MTPDKIFIIDPASSKLVWELPVHNELVLDDFVEKGRAAQNKWKGVLFSDRLKLFRKLKRYIQTNYMELAAVIKSETGKTLPDAMVDKISAVAEIHELEKRGEAYAYEKIPTHPFLSNKSASVFYEPHRLVGVITPWNLPLAIPAADIFPALFLGNAVIWKPSEYTPLTALELEKIMRKIGFPPDLLQVFLGYGEAGAKLCEAVDYVSFTGSCKTGKKVKEICDARGISCNLEMGGKAPAIVLSDANIERTAYALVYGAFSNSGQYCKSFERVYVHRAVFNEVVDRVLRLTNNLVPGKDYGPVITGFQLGIIRHQIEEARNKKAYVATGGQEVKGKNGNWYRPTVLLYVDHTMSVMKEETFGPVMPIMPFDDIEEAIALANDSRLGLNASIFTQNEKFFYEIAERIEAGNIIGNDAMVNWFITGTPQCGRRGSVFQSYGLPRHGRTGVQRFGRPKSIVWHEHPFFHLPFFKNKEPWWLPYNSLTDLALKAFLRGF